MSRRSPALRLAFAALLAPAMLVAGAALAEVSGEAVYQKHCSSCHEGNVPRAPHNIVFRMSPPERILEALESGVMKGQGAALSAEERVAVATYLAGSAPSHVADTKMKACPAGGTQQRGGATVSSWGMDARNSRFVDAGTAGITPQTVGGLQLKWVFDYPGATRARSQPTVDGDTVYVGSQSGTVHAIDLHSGCLHWAFKADTEVRAAVSIDHGTAGAPTVLYVGDTNGNLYALNAKDGSLRWRSSLADHKDVTITGSPKLFEGRLYVPMSSREWAVAADPNYRCCTFRGGVAAFDAATGKMLWKSYSIPQEPRETGKKNGIGVPIVGPSGAPVWNSPTIDAKRRLLYVGTGEAYTSPAADTSDSVLAFALDTGELVWSRQLLAKDAWNMSCFIGSSVNCPEENGPDLDIGAPPILVSLPDGRDVLVVGQKSGVVHALDPQAKGAVLWQRKIGHGGYAGGVHWGMAVAGETVFAPNADTYFGGPTDAPRFPGLFALDVATGAQKWFTPAVDGCKPEDKPACDPGFSAPATAVPGLVFAGAFDGQLRAFDSQSGKVLWTYATNREFTSVSGRKAHGGSIESAGPVVANGYVLVNSGYLFGSRMPGNVLLAFSTEQVQGNAVGETR